MHLLTLSLFASTAAAAPSIVNGTEAGPNEFPEVVMLNVDNGGTCTGSLIHPEWVLTAAHCFDSISIDDVPDGNTELRFGTYGRENPTRTVDADLVIVHEDYVALPGETANGLGPHPLVPGYETMTNDIALVHLAESVNQTVMALNASPIDETWLGRDVTHIGYGITRSGLSDSGTKRHAVVPVVSYTPAHSSDNTSDNGGISFFDGENGRSTCQGDSGGPGVFYQGGGYAQVGITSYGIECGAGLGTKMRVDLYIDWIIENAGITPITEFLRPPSITCSHQLNPDSVNSIAIGTVPMDLQCLVESGDPENIQQVTWYWGDGTAADVRTGLRGSHVYDTMGVYNLRACVETERQGVISEDCILKPSHVNACDVPEPSFEATPIDGVSISLRNTTSLRAHNCVSNAQWEVFEGEVATGEPVLVLSGWEPNLQLEDPGTYTVVLNVGGLGGSGAAGATVEVGRSVGCSSLALSPLLAPLLGFLPLLGLRRRS